MSYNARYNDSDLVDTSDEDENEDMASSKQDKPSSSSDQKKGPTISINEALKKALDRAAEPGVGDEEPEVLPPPNQPAYHADMKRSHDGKDGDEEEGKSYKRPQHPAPAANPSLSASTIEYFSTTEEDEGTNMISMAEKAKYIPLRLTYEERKILRLVGACVNVSDYTTNIDVAFKTASKRHHQQLQHIVGLYTGILTCLKYTTGQEVMESRSFEKYEKDIQSAIEIFRRYKILNPDNLRSEYGKLTYTLQDAHSENNRQLLNINAFVPVKTVYDVLVSVGAEAMLEDKYIDLATDEILCEPSTPRHIVQEKIQRKERAVEYIVKKYVTKKFSNDLLRQCLYSIGDYKSFLNAHTRPIKECIKYLQTYFAPKDDGEEGDGVHSLGIQEGVQGARLTHTHTMQYNFVLQSLTLWFNILHNFYKLWHLAEEDLLQGEPYVLQNTGQGLQRVQPSPRVYKAMHEILVHTQHSLGSWVGSSVIHLGDHNVPNALVFIDKYTQVSRILGPLVTTLRNLEKLSDENEGLNRYLQAYGGLEKAKKDILCDFFTHAFDGSGGDNFFDAGSCIDGRLTSAWNWCSQLSRKPYYPLFRLTGFLSFDGEFEKSKADISSAIYARTLDHIQVVCTRSRNCSLGDLPKKRFQCPPKSNIGHLSNAIRKSLGVGSTSTIFVYARGKYLVPTAATMMELHRKYADKATGVLEFTYTDVEVFG